MTLGQLFKSKRNEIGKSLEQISSATKIHYKILSALEEDHYTDLPARTFTRGFIVSYCKALKLDPEKTIEEYKGFLEEKFAERQDKDKGHQGYVFEGKELEQNKRWLIFGASTAAIFAIAVLLVFKPQNHKRKEKHKEFTEESVETAEDAPPTLNPPADPSATPLTLGAGGTAASSSSPSLNKILPNASMATTSIAPVATVAVVPAVAVAAATPTPVISATPAPIKKVEVVAATPTPEATPRVLTDKLNKGDDLEPKDATRKVTVQALEDVFVRYQIDQKPPMAFILRKGKFLAVKAKEKLTFDTNHPQSLRYKTKGSYHDLIQDKFTVETTGRLSNAEQGVVGALAFPKDIAPSATASTPPTDVTPSPTPSN